MQNPTAYIYPNLTVILIFRGKQCVKLNGTANTAEHIGMAIAQHWKGPYMRYATEPIFGWNVRNEDPFLWRNQRGFHLLTHAQIGRNTSWKGGYGYSQDGLNWNYINNFGNYTSVWPNYVEWNNGSKTVLYRRQKPSLIFDQNNTPKYLINGVDIGDLGNSAQWETAWTLMQPINS